MVFTCPQTVTHPGTNHLIATRPGVEPMSSLSQVHRPNSYTAKILACHHEGWKAELMLVVGYILRVCGFVTKAGEGEQGVKQTAVLSAAQSLL